MSGVTWGASRAKGGAAASMHGSGPPPSSFNSPRIASSSASVHSTAESPSSSTRVTPPTPRAPEPRRYEFSQNHPPPRNSNQRRGGPTNDSRLSLDSYAHSLAGGGGGGSSIYSNSASFVPRQRSATGPAPNGWRGMGQNGNGNGSQTNLAMTTPLSPVYYDPDAPPMPNLSNPAFKKHGSRESSMLNLSHRSGGSQSPSGGNSTTTVPLKGDKGFVGSSSARPGFYPHRSSSPDSSASSNPSFPPRHRSPSSQNQLSHQRYQGPVEPLFMSSASPFRFNRAPVLRIVVPLPSNVSWPSGAALKMCHRELDASGLLSKMRFGDLVENLCVSWRRREEGVAGGWTSGAMVFIPPFLHPLSTANSLPPVSPLSFTPSHLPPTMDSFLHSPTYYHAILPLPYIIFLDLLPFGQQIFQSLRLANQRTELPSSRGEILSVDVWIHEAAFTIGGGAAEGGGGWGAGGAGGGEGMEVGPWAGTTVILESDGTKEGKDDLLSRISGPRGTRRPWEILGSKSTRGSVWLKLVRESIPLHEA
ncbi:hypothetical protein BDY24DRAFT_138535 [Mrakia frigida]|uniref:uncharacterized protein n=1 Tax=Mrakia frigida TaxID=29902 RepID=UPI003FCC1890